MFMTLIWVAIGVVAAAAFVAWRVYSTYQATNNMIVALDQRCNTALADIDVHLKHRHNLIPGLVEVVKGVKGHETEMVLGIVQARTEALKALQGNIKLKAEGNLTAQIGTLLSSAEKSPELRALPEFANLRNELKACEERITAARRFYNLAIEEYNIAIRQFPGNKIATKMRLSTRQPFDLGVERVLIDEPLALSF